MKIIDEISKLTDLELVTRFSTKKDKHSLSLLFERYTRFVFLVCLKYLKDEEQSKDETMQIFENLITTLPKHEISNFKPWLHTVTRNHCLMLIRSGKLHKEKEKLFSKELQNDVESDIFLHLDNNNKEKNLQQLEKAINNLNSEQRVCIDLFYLQEKSYKEVSEITGFSLNEVKSHIQNGKRNLKISLAGNILNLIIIMLQLSN